MDSHRGLEGVREDIQDGVTKPIDPNPNAPNYPIGAMRLLVHGEQQRRLTADGSLLNCVVVERNPDIKSYDAFSAQKDPAASDYDAFAELIAKIKREHPEANMETSMRVQVIVKQAAHYTTVDLELSRDNNTCIVLDAGADPRGMTKLPMALSKLTNSDNQPLFSEITIIRPNQDDGRRPQNDLHNCPAFSMAHACEASKIASLHRDLVNSATPPNGLRYRFIDWRDAPPSLVKDAQSFTFLKDYVKTNVRAAELPELTDGAAYPQKVIMANKKKGEPEKKITVNDAVSQTLKRYQQQAEMTCKLLTSSAVMEIVARSPEASVGLAASPVSKSRMYQTLAGGSFPAAKDMARADAEAPPPRRTLQRKAPAVPNDGVSQQVQTSPLSSSLKENVAPVEPE